MSSTNPLFLILLATGFTVGFGHCIGMCGPLVVSLTLNLKGQRVLVPQLLYHAGRITTYTCMGGFMGLTGSFTTVTAGLDTLQKFAMVFAGILIIVMGLSMSGWIPLRRLFGDHYNPEGILSKGFHRLTESKSTITYYPLGLLLGLLPCGPVYTALIAAARTGMESASTLDGALAGAGLMSAFGLGTVPALFILGRLVGVGWLRSREIIYRIGAVLMILVGIYFVIKGIRY